MNNQTNAGNTGKAPEKGIAAELYFWAQALVFALLILVTLNTFFFRVSGVQGSSMYPTLEDGNQVVMRIIGYDTPERGDIIVVMPDGYGEGPLIKRVIAIENDVINIDDATGNVSVNGEVLFEPYIAEMIRSGNAGEHDYPYTVPGGHVFVMGDNRNHSTDSRNIERVGGALPYENIIGKVLFRLWPPNKIGTLS
jgi:signal peptidase I